MAWRGPDQLIFPPMVSLNEQYVPPLFTRFPQLKQSFPHRSLGTFPTTITRLETLCAETGKESLFVKHDDISGPLYGGNKVRKLEFLLAEALRQGAVRVITSGGAGSNHALATALYAHQVGLKTTLILFDQPVSEAVRENLLRDAGSGAEMIYEERYENLGNLLYELVDRYQRIEGAMPYVIPVGGSSPIGVLGYVNAALELDEQIKKGIVPEPQTIFVPFGSMGTVAGLVFGLRAVGVKSRIHAVRVVPASLANGKKCNELINQVGRLLRNADASFPEVDVGTYDMTVDHDFFEPGYGLATQTVLDAVHKGWETDRLNLDVTYSGKAFAAFLSAAQGRKAAGPLLFWDTKNSRPFPREDLTRHYQELPTSFHRFFMERAGDAGRHGSR
jgi:1-aminocyclopropane-1-carboxylate deaminase/D-cysteine desulfhydrase-like pyridoxal-dependent ACC family enzyme